MNKDEFEREWRETTRKIKWSQRLLWILVPMAFAIKVCIIVTILWAIITVVTHFTGG